MRHSLIRLRAQLSFWSSPSCGRVSQEKSAQIQTNKTSNAYSEPQGGPAQNLFSAFVPSPLRRNGRGEGTATRKLEVLGSNLPGFSLLYAPFIIVLLVIECLEQASFCQQGSTSWVLSNSCPTARRMLALPETSGTILSKWIVLSFTSIKTEIEETSALVLQA